MPTKSNARMPAVSARNIEAMYIELLTWRSPHRKHALQLWQEVGGEAFFRVLHAMRRWYSGQTMARALLHHHDVLEQVMDLRPNAVCGVYRGFKVDSDAPLAEAEEGELWQLTVRRNHGFSSWSLSEGPTHKFSGASRGKVGLVVRLVSVEGLTPVLAPPSHSETWFNRCYEHLIGSSFRPKEEEYLISGSPVVVKIVRVKRRT